MAPRPFNPDDYRLTDPRGQSALRREGIRTELDRIRDEPDPDKKAGMMKKFQETLRNHTGEQARHRTL